MRFDLILVSSPQSRASASMYVEWCWYGGGREAVWRFLFHLLGFVSGNSISPSLHSITRSERTKRRESVNSRSRFVGLLFLFHSFKDCWWRYPSGHAIMDVPGLIELIERIEQRNPHSFSFPCTWDETLKFSSALEPWSLEAWHFGYREKVDIPHRIGYDMHQLSTSMIWPILTFEPRRKWGRGILLFFFFREPPAFFVLHSSFLGMTSTYQVEPCMRSHAGHANEDAIHLRSPVPSLLISVGPFWNLWSNKLWPSYDVEVS